MSTETVHTLVQNFQSFSPGFKTNVYGVVVYIGSKGNGKCTNVTIVDETCEFNEKLKFCVFNKGSYLQSLCEIGDVLRFHRIKVQNFNGPQGVSCESASTWVLFKRTNPTEYSGNNVNSVVTDEDFSRVKQLLEWVKTNPRNKAMFEAGLSIAEAPVTDFNENDLEMAASIMNLHTNEIQMPSISVPDISKLKLSNFSLMTQNGYVDLVCQISAICDNKGVKFLLVTDGTKCNLAVHQENDFSLMSTLAATTSAAANSEYKTKILYSKKASDYLFQVYIFDEFVAQLDTLEPGDFILLKNARTCAPPQSSGADLLIKMPGIQNANQSKYGRGIFKLASYQSVETRQGLSTNQEVNAILERLHQKIKELGLKFITEEEFRTEFQAGFLSDSFDELIENNPKKNDPKLATLMTKKQSILSQVNQMMNEDTQMYYSSEEEVEEILERDKIQPEILTKIPILTENNNITNIIQEEPMIQEEEQHQIDKYDPHEISEDIFKLKRLVNLTYLCPFINSDNLNMDEYSKMYPFYTSLKHFIQDSKSKKFLKCKVIAKLYNYSTLTSPHIATVFVSCKKCNYINFTPFHLANLHHGGTLNNIMKDFNEILEENQNEVLQNNWINFSLNWIETVTPLQFDAMTQTQCTSEPDSQVLFNYFCPRCQFDGNETQELDYMYRFWFTLRDKESTLDPCLLESDLAENFLDGIKAIKFYSSQAKAHQVYKNLHKNFNKKFLFTLEAFNLNENGSLDDVEEINQRGKKIRILYKIVKMEEILSK
ncbi:unnamed protein product [Brachionus calyciflorus]|uniref:Protection of telomeres protein 1 n=1 Tax=Brachionus calyciflorus TaxID=104777 RepID=A0A814IW57_9BILA|nr:unnamed protein product [Brachionus calyciflorus]